jgi:hypothetical protein
VIRCIVVTNTGAVRVRGEDGLVMTRGEAERFAKNLAKTGESVAVYEEIARFDPAEPVRSQPR